MAIIPISLEEFNFYYSSRNEIISTFISEKQWFTDSKRNIIGTITLDKLDNDWGYAILAKHEDGLYRGISVETSIESYEKAEKAIITAMSQIERNDKAAETLFIASKSAGNESDGSLLVKDINTELKKYLYKHPEKLYDLTPRKFEELIASILEDIGFDVEITQASRDGGSDIIAYIRNAVCEYLTLVECKKYAPENKVGVGIIREVTGVHYLKKATKSIIVTTSYFSIDAQKEAKQFEHQLSLKDYDSIKEWLKRYSQPS